ncbi:hypothetical protein GCM10009555_088080 [Acrocarpospora macrocephala]|uniref:Lipoprotein n=1 Tax=Acrocarpospora macrocephala TaxID=150177 RepID=A0A5M3XBC2_9ACTN|nr:hypothetical protein [Acrocarpospora macrocephala]GES16791.1 hypothetical protein Amac_103890 [Acrocarpospora macrocephala]
MAKRSAVLWTTAILLSAVPCAAVVSPDVHVHLCANLIGPETPALGISFAVMANLLPLVLLALALAGRKKTLRQGRLLAWLGAAATLTTAACYAFSSALFFSYCPEGSLAPWFAMTLYVTSATLLFLSETRADQRHMKAA